jgi:hypothetical protein
MDTSIEELIGKIESAAAPVYLKLLDGKIPGNDQDRANFAQFLAISFFRSPASLRMTGELMGRHMQIMCYAYAINDRAFNTSVKRFEESEGSVLSEKQREELRESMIDPSKFELQISQERALRTIGAADKLLPVLFNMNWAVIEPKHGFFVSSDNPLVKVVDPRTIHPIYGDHGFLNKTIRVTYPLSPKSLLLLSWDHIPRGFTMDRTLVDVENNNRAANSERYIYSHIRHKEIMRLCTRLKDSRPGMTTEGFGPKKFADVVVKRRFSRTKQ